MSDGRQVFIYNLQPKAGLEGSEYLSENWSDAIIALKNNDTIPNYSVLIDLYNWALDIKTETEIKVLPGMMIRDFYLGKGKAGGDFEVESHFVNPEAILIN